MLESGTLNAVKVYSFLWHNQKVKVFYDQEPPSGESTTPECEVNYQLLAVIYWELLVAVNHNQLRTMASETADPIGWSHPHPQGQYPLNSTYCMLLTRPTNRKTCCSNQGSNTHPWECQAKALPMRPLRV